MDARRRRVRRLLPVLTERGRERFRGIERADSVTLDPHKGMFLPYGTGALVVRDGENLRQAHYEGAAYLQDLAPAGELPNYSEYSAELSREWRGLRVWLPLKLHGVSRVPRGARREARPRRALYEGLTAIPELELPWAPQLTVVAFRLRDARRRDEQAVPRARSTRASACSCRARSCTASTRSARAS